MGRLFEDAQATGRVLKKTAMSLMLRLSDIADRSIVASSLKILVVAHARQSVKLST